MKNNLLSIIVLSIIFYNYSYTIFNVKYGTNNIKTKQQHKHRKRHKGINRHQFKYNNNRRFNHYRNPSISTIIYPNTVFYDNYYDDSLYNNEFEILGKQLANYSSPRKCYNQCADKCFRECTNQGGWAYQCRPNCNKNCAKLCNHSSLI